ncbi:uncharacterized protein [Euphorbia lathyris]|uniref:uncharacterized protein isoform X3 n=1 Tax=Euphorbia lathyris TaxID=212925 RepID=UPI003313516C
MVFTRRSVMWYTFNPFSVIFQPFAVNPTSDPPMSFDSLLNLSAGAPELHMVHKSKDGKYVADYVSNWKITYYLFVRIQTNNDFPKCESMAYIRYNIRVWKEQFWAKIRAIH